jgi:hypothetical protein
MKLTRGTVTTKQEASAKKGESSKNQGAKYHVIVNM